MKAASLQALWATDREDKPLERSFSKLGIATGWIHSATNKSDNENVYAYVLEKQSCYEHKADC